jgi:hypothetical protein
MEHHLTSEASDETTPAAQAATRERRALAAAVLHPRVALMIDDTPAVRIMAANEKGTGWVGLARRGDGCRLGFRCIRGVQQQQ